MSDQPKPERPIPRIGTGSPATMRLEVFGQYIADAFGHVPYHVGSSTRGKQWRDVDIRLILPDDTSTPCSPATSERTSSTRCGRCSATPSVNWASR
jgi:hypothetical protein